MAWSVEERFYMSGPRFGDTYRTLDCRVMLKENERLTGSKRVLKWLSVSRPMGILFPDSFILLRNLDLSRGCSIQVLAESTHCWLRGALE